MQTSKYSSLSTKLRKKRWTSVQQQTGGRHRGKHAKKTRPTGCQHKGGRKIWEGNKHKPLGAPSGAPTTSNHQNFQDKNKQHIHTHTTQSHPHNHHHKVRSFIKKVNTHTMMRRERIKRKKSHYKHQKGCEDSSAKSTPHDGYIKRETCNSGQCGGLWEGSHRIAEGRGRVRVKARQSF